MSMSWLRSMSPMHLQYLKNMGVTGTLVASLVRKDQLWGLIACHHYSPKKMPYALRTACDLVAEVVATRVAVLENFTQVRTEALVRRLEGRVIEATSTHGDWRQALLEDPQSLLRMVGASGAIAGVMGAYLIWCWRSRVTLLVPIIIIPLPVKVPAVLYLLVWIGWQWLAAGAASSRSVNLGGVAWWAHIGGFTCGVLGACLIRPLSEREAKLA